LEFGRVLFRSGFADALGPHRVEGRRRDDLPSFVTDQTVTPTPFTPMGAKGIGEAATIGSTPAIVNAVVDALRPVGVRHLDMPLRPERVWQALRAKKSSSRGGGRIRMGDPRRRG